VTVIPSEPDAAIVVDGISVEEAVQLPPGRHRVRVEKEGFEPWERLIPVTDARDARVQVRLSPQTATRLKYERDAERLRVWSYVSLAGGAAMAGTSVALAIWNNGRNADWEREDEALDAVFRAGPPYPEDAQARQAKNDELLNAIEQTDVAVLSTAIIGAAGLAIGVALLGFGPDPHRYRTEVGLGPGAASCRVSF
jgi:hypothetical protein